MLEINLFKEYNCSKSELFELIDSIQKLSGIKRSLKNYRIARDEPGLQIIDNAFRIAFIKIYSRLRYTTQPDISSDLKQIKGGFKEYYCLYSLKTEGELTRLDIQLRIKLPYGPIGFIVRKLINPFYKIRLNKEMKAIKKLLNKKPEVV